MSDLINRQDAIYHLKKRLYQTAEANFNSVDVYMDIAENRITTWLNELPSAQPERKTDNSCDGCAFIGCYETDYPCATCARRNKDYFTPTPKMEVEHETD